MSLIQSLGVTGRQISMGLRQARTTKQCRETPSLYIIYKVFIETGYFWSDKIPMFR